ncbi:MAG: glutamate synthase [Anaerolineae bacterium]|nr:glutamate synthase [Anaerolineae bacterium]
MDNQLDITQKLIAARASLAPQDGFHPSQIDDAAEGGCGVIGMASSEQVAARHMLQALQQMRNRGNGKGGGIAAVGLVPEDFGVSRQVLDEDYMLAIAYLDAAVRQQVEQEFIQPVFEVDHVHEQAQIEDHTVIAGLDVRPPDVVVYFVRPKAKTLAAFQAENKLEALSPRALEDEFVFQNTFRLNQAFYASRGEKLAFVLSHGKNLLVLKMVGFGDDVIRYYRLEETRAHVWIGHHRYPTKGRVWHPGGAHPFIGMNEALVHNGDFANYASISEYLAQRNIFPQFLTDTEVSVQVFDLLYRTYNYPLEYVIETLAPTTERDFTMLPPEKQRIYAMLQTTHMHASPDGPWFFLIAQADRDKQENPIYRLTGITDTSMLRPQVFAWQESAAEDGSQVAIGFAASEKQAIDAALHSLAEEDARFWTRADRYWNARGGSHTDGGAFMFSVKQNGAGRHKLVLTDKFGSEVEQPTHTPAYDLTQHQLLDFTVAIPDLPAGALFNWVREHIAAWSYDDVLSFIKGLAQAAQQDHKRQHVIEVFTLLMDRRYPTGKLRRSSLLSLYDKYFAQVMAAIRKMPSSNYTYVVQGDLLPDPASAAQTVVVDAREYEAEGEASVARELQRLYAKGFRKFIVAYSKGHRFFGSGLGVGASGVRIDVYGSPGDYLASGIDGAEIHVHRNAQDQLAQIMKAGKLVVHGDVGQTFMYGAKGGEAYVLGNAAGRPLINAVGRPRVVINGTCLDYLAESFMAGDPLNGGGFVILNGMAFDEAGALVELDTPYPGGNLFSLASGGAIYVRDPHGKLSQDQLNGGEFVDLSAQDWERMLPYLEENARQFGIDIEQLLTVNGERLTPEQVYCKIQPRKVRALQAEEAWVGKH